MRRFFAAAGRLGEERIEAVAEAVHGHEDPVRAEEIADQVGLSTALTTTALSRLHEVGAVEVLASGEVASADGEDVAEAAAEAADAQENLRRFARSRVEMMRGYANTRDCRRGFLLNYFGETFAAP